MSEDVSGFPLRGLTPVTLGTVQLGVPYGLGAAACGLDAAAARTVLTAAWTAGIRCFDTAPDYGAAEGRIGQWIGESGAAPLLISKLPALAGVPSEALAEFARRSVDASCGALGRDMLSGLLLHKAVDMGREGIAAALRDLRDRGRISAFGASVYTVDEARQALAMPGISLLQVPGSLLNPGLFDAGVVADAAAAGVTVFVRSAFVQGLLLRSPDDLPAHLHAAMEVLNRLNHLANEAGVSMLQLALSAVAEQPGVASLVLGFDAPQQLREAVAALAGPRLDADFVAAAYRIGRTTPIQIADPRFWRRD